MEPVVGLVMGGISVIIFGKGFTEDIRVFFGEAESVSVSVQSGEMLKVVIFLGMEGAVDVIVEIEYGTGGMFGGFVYMDADL